MERVLTGIPADGPLRPVPAFVLVAGGTVLGIAGTDLVLPAVPSLPAALGGSPAQAQLVLAAFVAGTALGLLLFGELGARFDRRWLLAGSLAAYGLVSAAAGLRPRSRSWWRSASSRAPPARPRPCSRPG
jgi:MFS family permease